MPAEEEVLVEAFAFCRDRSCPGYVQRPVEAVKRTVSWSFEECGGDNTIPGVAKSSDYYRFANPEDADCQFCHAERQVDPQERVEFADAKPESNDPEVHSGIVKLMVEQAEKLARLEAAQAEVEVA